MFLCFFSSLNNLLNKKLYIINNKPRLKMIKHLVFKTKNNVVYKISQN